MALSRSWVESANGPDCDFPLENLPFGAARRAGRTFLCVAIGDRVLDLKASAEAGLLPDEVLEACEAGTLNPLLALGPGAWSAMRERLARILAEQTHGETRAQAERCLFLQSECAMIMPLEIGDYTDFYASIDHATRVGRLFRPESPLLPNYRYVPIGYHGRASSILVSGNEVRRPFGQIREQNGEPRFAPSASLDYEIEVGAVVGKGNDLGRPVPIADAEEHLFGLCLVNDWSARDVQSWEYQPLGPFLAKSFATSVSPWIVPLEALAPYRVPVRTRGEGEPAPLPYLTSATSERDGIDLHLEVFLQSRVMRAQGIAPFRVSRSNLRHLYWSLRQLVTHHVSNGCNLRAGDLLATGTVSGPEEGAEGCLLELRHREAPLRLPSGEQRVFLADGDQVTLRGYASREGMPRIGFGECAAVVREAGAA
jgi:fumarylacetoacetase